MSVGIVFLGHGTRLVAGTLECLSFTHGAELTVRERIGSLGLDVHFRTAFLELHPPSLDTAVEELVALGFQHIVICPLFLFEAGHMKEDIPQLVADTTTRFPNVTLRLLAQSIGSTLDVVRAATDHARITHLKLQSLTSSTPYNVFSEQWGETHGLLFVGRGSKDESAYTRFHELAQSIASELQLTQAQYDCTFLAGIGKRFEAGLSTLQERGIRNITVLPYLLFRGLLTDALPRQVEAWQEQDVRTRDLLKVDIAPQLAIHPCVQEHIAAKVICGILERV